jgi:hypothetical protein
VDTKGSRLTTSRTIASIAGYCPSRLLKNVVSAAMTLKAYSVLLSTKTSAASQMVDKFRRGFPLTKILKAIAPASVCPYKNLAYL